MPSPATGPPDDSEHTSGGEEEFERVDEPRGDRGREWEVFCRESTDEPLRHVGSVTAPSAAVAREQATTLFGWRAETVWLCPADETVRLAAEGVSLAGRTGEDTAATTGDRRR